MPQVNIYVTGTDRIQFADYATQFGLDVTALSNLLLVRELRVGRLGDLRSKCLPGPRNVKITAHIARERREDFAARARNVALSVSEAGALLVVAELEKRWLEKSVDNL